ncbi:MAG: DUF2384 domain-containing protein [Gammaproteobacteria bacterium]|nr:DUF2384 domain-containing protein [Gammaproteobacteria bacterium]
MQIIKKMPALTAPRKNSVALKAFFGVTQKWGLSREEERVLLGVPKATFYRWRQHLEGSLTPDTLERISYVLGIYKALRILIPNEKSANQWVHKPNAAALFNGSSALQKLMNGRVIDLADVRRYLDAERGW